MNYSTLARLAALVSTLVLTAPVAAQEAAPTAEKITLSATLGYGISMDDGDFNPYGLGLGVRGGYTLDMNVYVGGFFNFFLGESEEILGVDVSARILPLALEGGYDIVAGPVVIRPTLGLGLAIAMSSASGSQGGVEIDSSDTETRLLLAPGANVLYPIDNLFVGGELRYYWIPSEDSGDAFLIAANIGTML